MRAIAEFVPPSLRPRSGAASEARLGSIDNHPVDRDAGYTASYMETLVMTERGVDVLSRLPRTLTVLPA